MQLGILGLPKAGKTALFNALTASRQETGKFKASRTTNIGVAHVDEPRLERLSALYSPRRCVPAQVRFVDVPGIDRGRGETLDLAELRMMDALVHVVRAFEDPELVHPAGCYRQRKLGPIDGYGKLGKEITQPADVILVAVG